MTKGHWRMVMILGLVSVWYGAFTTHFHPFIMTGGFLLLMVGWFFLTVEIDFNDAADNDHSPDDDEPRNKF